MKTYKKYFILSAPPEEVYIALTNPLTILIWTGEPAEMSTEINSEFSLWDGSIIGKNLAFEENKKIEQEWYFENENDEEKSIVTILLHEHKKGTSMEVKHINIPEQDYDAIAEGWEEIYVGSLMDFYANGE